MMMHSSDLPQGQHCIDHKQYDDAALNWTAGGWSIDTMIKLVDCEWRGQCYVDPGRGQMSASSSQWLWYMPRWPWGLTWRRPHHSLFSSWSASSSHCVTAPGLTWDRTQICVPFWPPQGQNGTHTTSLLSTQLIHCNLYPPPGSTWHTSQTLWWFTHLTSPKST